jgi:mono/diheme cytochrome c family protein
MGLPRALALVALVLPLSAQAPSYGLGRAPNPDELSAWDIAVGPDGKELPSGSGTVAEGGRVYAANCAACHGKTGKEGPNDVLVGGLGTLNTKKPVKTIGSYWPCATTSGITSIALCRIRSPGV